MITVNTFTSFLNFNVLLILAPMILSVLEKLWQKSPERLSAKSLLNIHYFFLSLVFLGALIHPFIPQSDFLVSSAKIWMAPSLKSFDSQFKISEPGGYMTLPAADNAIIAPLQALNNGYLLISFVVIVVAAVLFLRQLHKIINIIKEAHFIRRQGRIRILTHPHLVIPFSFYFPGSAFVILPSSLLTNAKHLRMVISHEIQHHRQGDTFWVYLLWGLRTLCFFNPGIYFWDHKISEIQEFACDETLTGHKGFDSQAYAGCLFEMAQTVVKHSSGFIGAKGFFGVNGGEQLKRRIENMFYERKAKINGLSLTLASTLFLTLAGVAALATKGVIQDRRVDINQAQAMAERAQKDTDFPIIVNDLVLKQLNKYLGTPDGRDFMKESLLRMQNYKPVIDSHIEKYGVPNELLAIPIIESGYKNLTQGQSHTSMKSAGLWQFIPGTARNFGLLVEAKKDERLDVPKASDAAIRYLQSNHLRFQDWHLSILAYNIGEHNLQMLMTNFTTRDPWTIIRKTKIGDADYLPKLMASVIIMKNPESVN